MLIYYITPARFKNLALLILSLIFYSWGEVRYFPIMMYCILFNFFLAIAIEKCGDPRKRKWLMALVAAGNIAPLLFFKYTDFFIWNLSAVFGLGIEPIGLTLPLGISFYTFQTLSYSIDVYRGKVEAQKDVISLGVFVTMFPQLIAGPIVRYTDISRELKNRRITMTRIESGAFTFIMGLGSKVLIANNVGALWDTMAEMGLGVISAPMAWLGLTAFSLQIYFDFSGYSLMAIGLGHMLGFDFPQNFDYPYIAKSATEFWRRWHMTLGSWFREYVYIPLGGSRAGIGRQVFNLFVVWALTGFWHGASWNFVFWGLYFCVLIVIEKLWLLKYLEKSRVLSHLYLIFAVMISWAIFKIEDGSQLGLFLGRMFSGATGADWTYYLRSYAVVMLIGIICSTPLLKRLYRKVEHIGWARVLIAAPVLILSVAYLVDSTYNPFLYFRF